MSVIQSKIIKAVKRSENMTQRLSKINPRNDRHDRIIIHLNSYCNCIPHIPEAIEKTGHFNQRHEKYRKILKLHF